MTWALCFNCGEVKFGAICPCPKCEVKSTGDISLDIAFSDHNMTKETLEEFGKVVGAIHSQCDDLELCFWAFIRYVSIHHPSILSLELDPKIADKCDALLSQVSLPTVHLTAVRNDSASESSQAPDRKPWWKFWNRSTKR